MEYLIGAAIVLAVIGAIKLGKYLGEGIADLVSGLIYETREFDRLEGEIDAMRRQLERGL